MVDAPGRFSHPGHPERPVSREVTLAREIGWRAYQDLCGENPTTERRFRLTLRFRLGLASWRRGR